MFFYATVPLMWKIKHSLIFVMLSDAVILGASSVKHLEENLKSSKNGRLHEGELTLRLVWEKMSCPALPLVAINIAFKSICQPLSITVWFDFLQRTPISCPHHFVFNNIIITLS